MHNNTHKKIKNKLTIENKYITKSAADWVFTQSATEKL